jgi:hypothetical protein
MAFYRARMCSKQPIGVFMSRSKFPTAKSIFEAAAKLGLAVRIEYGPNGKIASVQTMGKTDSVALNGTGDTNPWDEVLGDEAN